MRGALPVVIGTALLWALFQGLNPNFLTAQNLTNLALQIASAGVLATGVVLVLLMGEIDLAAGASSGLCAAVMAVLSVRHGWPAPAAAGMALCAGALVGALQGVFTAAVGVPSFIVSLAGLLAWQGALLAVLGDTGSINLRDPDITSLAGEFLPVPWGLAVVIALVSVAVGRERLRRLALPVLAVAVGTVVFSLDRGVPVSFLLLLLVVTITDVALRRTRGGRHLMAVGGNAEAARRAGISVARVRMAAFCAAGALAAFSGILAAARVLSVHQSSGAGDTLLNAIAAAVIGGTSLHGGVGGAWSALLGALLVGTISNGMDLLAVGSAAKFMATGGVLLCAVTLDAWTRRRRR